MSLALVLSASFNISNAQAVEKGSVLLDLYVGGPTSNTLWGSLTTEVPGGSEREASKERGRGGSAHPTRFPEV